VQEMESISKNQTWTLIKLRPCKTTNYAKWVLKLKPIIDGSNFKHKAQLMAHNFQQKEGINFQKQIPLLKNGEPYDQLLFLQYTITRRFFILT
jgi:hypothetical protein